MAHTDLWTQYAVAAHDEWLHDLARPRRTRKGSDQPRGRRAGARRLTRAFRPES